MFSAKLPAASSVTGKGAPRPLREHSGLSTGDLFALGCAVVLALAFFFLPWLEITGTTVTGYGLLSEFVPGTPYFIYSFLWMFLVAIVLSVLAGVIGVVNARAQEYTRVTALIAGILALSYYVAFVIRDRDNSAHMLRATRMGYWLALLAAAGLIAQIAIKRPYLDKLHAAQRGQRARLPWRRNQAIRAWLFTLPMLTLMVTFLVYPIFGSVEIAFFNYAGFGEPTQYVGLRHFRTVAHDPMFWNAFWNTVTYTITLVPIQLTLALILAIILNNERMRFRLFYRTIYFLPVVTSTAVAAIVMRAMLSTEFGLKLSEFVGDLFNTGPKIPIAPHIHPTLSLPTIIVFGIWHSFGINLVLFMAALQTVPQDLYDAAKVDGANGRQTLIYVTLPSIRGVSLIILFFATLGSLSVFEQYFALTGGTITHSQVVSAYIYNYAFASQGPANLGFASAAALFMNLLVLSISSAQIIVSRSVGRSRQS